MPCPWAVNDRPVRVEVNESSGVPSERVQVTGVLVKDRVQHESAKLTLDVIRMEPATPLELKIAAVRMCEMQLEGEWTACGMLLYGREGDVA
jgi:hypothetical protein